MDIQTVFTLAGELTLALAALGVAVRVVLVAAKGFAKLTSTHVDDKVIEAVSTGVEKYNSFMSELSRVITGAKK